MKLEYRIKPVTRYVLTEYQEDDSGAAGVRTIGEYLNYDSAEKVFNAFAHHPVYRSQKYVVFMKHQGLYTKEDLPDVTVYFASSWEAALDHKQFMESNSNFEWSIAEIKE